MTAVSANDRIACPICSEQVHVMKSHLVKAHPELSFEEFREAYPEAPLLSPYATSIVEQKQKQSREAEVETEPKQAESKQEAEVEPKQEEVETERASVEEKPKKGVKPQKESKAQSLSSVIENEAPHVQDLERRAAIPVESEQVALHELLGLELKECMNAREEPIMVTRFTNHGFMDMVPDAKTYVWDDIDRAKDMFMALEFPGINGYFWGHYGTGKSSLATQACALTGRPMIRVQHTANVEEAHIVGQMLASNGSTYFNPGFLTLSMRYGFVYLADEYDFAFPQIVSVYQPILEGEKLVNKEATSNWSQIKPHANFRFIATGNTNGSGDDTGLYQGTNIQNAANYSRFGITSQVNYMRKETEVKILTSVTKCTEEDANKLVNFAIKIREGFEKGDISHPTGPRELINAAFIGTLRGNYRVGLEKAFINRLPASSGHAATEIAQRIFG